MVHWHDIFPFWYDWMCDALSFCGSLVVLEIHRTSEIMLDNAKRYDKNICKSVALLAHEVFVITCYCWCFSPLIATFQLDGNRKENFYVLLVTNSFSPFIWHVLDNNFQHFFGCTRDSF